MLTEVAGTIVLLSKKACYIFYMLGDVYLELIKPLLLQHTCNTSTHTIN
jgi:hypothetical protein